MSTKPTLRAVRRRWIVYVKHEYFGTPGIVNGDVRFSSRGGGQREFKRCWTQRGAERVARRISGKLESPHPNLVLSGVVERAT